MGLQSRIFQRLPVGVRAFSLDATFAVLGAISGVATLTAISRSPALGLLPVWARYVWAVALLVGCVCWGVGVLSVRIDRDRHAVVIRRAPVMVFGLTLVSTAAFVYALAVFVLAGAAGLISGLMLLAFAAGTWIERIRIISGLRGDD